MGNRLMQMPKTIYKWWSKFLTFFGDIKVFSYPLWLVYDPDDFQVGGKKVLEIFKTIKPGDVILRGYNKYLDGKFIPSKTKFSHGAIYVGEGKIIHAVADGVSLTNIIDFTRCDRIAIFRPKAGQESAIKKAQEFLKDKVPYDFGFKRGVSALYCFELCGECYDMLDVPRYTVKKFFGLVKKNNVYLGDSFFDSPDFKCVFNYNPALKADYSEVQY